MFVLAINVILPFHTYQSVRQSAKKFSYFPTLNDLKWPSPIFNEKKFLDQKIVRIGPQNDDLSYPATLKDL